MYGLKKNVLKFDFSVIHVSKHSNTAQYIINYNTDKFH